MTTKQPIPIFDQVEESNDGADLELFENVTEDEILSPWYLLKIDGISQVDAWQAIVTGIALDTVFARSKAVAKIEQ